MNGQNDVEVTLGLEVQREQFRQDLAGMKSDFEGWRTQVTSSPVEIPIRIRDEATSQLGTLMQSLQAQASAGISIPVNVSGSGAGGGSMSLYNPYASVAAGLLPSPLIQPMRGLGGIAAAETAAFAGTYGMSRSTLDSNISEVADAMTARQRLSEFASMGAGAKSKSADDDDTDGGGMMRGLRLFAGVEVAAKGIGAAFGSYDAALGARDPQIPQGSIAALREENRRIKEMREGFWGIVGRGRDFLNWGSHKLEPLSRNDDEFNDTLHTQENEKDVLAQQKRLRSDTAQSRLLSLGQSAKDFMDIGRDAYTSASTTDGLDKKIDEIKRQADRLADAYRKKADELDKVAADKDMPVAKQREAKALADDLRFAAGTVPQGIASAETNDARRAFNLDRDLRQQAIATHIESTELSNQSMAMSLTGNTLGARLSSIRGEQDTALAALTGQYRSGRHTPGGMTQTQYYDQAGQIDARATIQGFAAQQADLVRYQDMRNATVLNAYGNDYARDRMAIQLGLDGAMLTDAYHGAQHQALAQSAFDKLQRQEGEDIRHYTDAIHLDQVEHGTDLPGGEWLGPRTQAMRDRGIGGANPERARALQLQWAAQDELAKHMPLRGAADNAQDAALRQAIKDRTAQEARRLEDSTSDPRAKQILEGLIRKNYGARAGSERDPADVKAFGADGTSGDGALRDAVRDGMREALNGLQSLYVVKN